MRDTPQIAASALIINLDADAAVSVISAHAWRGAFSRADWRRYARRLIRLPVAAPGPRAREPRSAEIEFPMSRSPMIVRTVPALRRALDSLRARKATLALVPTMGALHDGHVSLVRLAKRRAGKVVVSIFVNPTQFAPTEDFGSYPRTWKADVGRLAAEDVDLIWHPGVEVMYPEGFATRIVPEGPAIAGLEDSLPPAFLRRRRHRRRQIVHAGAGRISRSSAKRTSSSCGW